MPRSCKYLVALHHRDTLRVEGMVVVTAESWFDLDTQLDAIREPHQSPRVLRRAPEPSCPAA